MVTTIKDGKTFANINDLSNWSGNPRSIKEKDFTRLKTQITRLGQHTPLLVDKDGVVYGGNMRIRAYKDLGINEVWVSVIEGDKAKKLEYALSSNDRAGFYDDDLLANLIPDYPDFNWEDYAVDMKEPQNLQDLIDKFTPVEEDEVPEVPTEAISKLGEVYQLGRHRLMCGDATKIEDVEKLMDGQKANVLITDPPYGVDYSAKNDFLNAMDKGNRNQKAIENDNITDYKQFFTDWLINLKDKFDNTFYIFISGKEISNLIQAIKDCNYHYAQEIVWVKNNHVLGRMDYAPKHENIVYGWQNTHKFFGGFQTSIINYDKPLSSELHPTMKPIGLIAKLIKDSTLENNIVLDLFGGSGSTLIACEQTNRTCYMMELDPLYCDVIRKRYENLTNKNKVLV